MNRHIEKESDEARDEKRDELRDELRDGAGSPGVRGDCRERSGFRESIFCGQPDRCKLMNSSDLRRAALGLTLHGPFSLNRRRRREVRPLVVSAGVVLVVVGAVVGWLVES